MLSYQKSLTLVLILWFDPNFNVDVHSPKEFQRIYILKNLQEFLESHLVINLLWKFMVGI